MYCTNNKLFSVIYVEKIHPRISKNKNLGTYPGFQGRLVLHI